MNLINQRGSRDCAVATLAMVTGIDYDSILDYFDNDLGRNIEESNGALDYDVEIFLMRKGFAICRGVSSVKDAELRPKSPFANCNHIAIVYVGDSRHYIAVEADGSVLDPALGLGRSLSDYTRVDWLTAVVPIPEFRKSD